MTPATARTAGVVGLVGVLGWIGLIWLGVQLYGENPRTAGFDLELLLNAGRAVAAGQSPYDPALVAGAAPVAERLFYSYPPVVAQLVALAAPIPSAVMFVGWAAAAVGGLGFVARALAIRFGSSINPNVVALATVALVPLMFPFAIGLLFGNLDVFFPLAFGLLLLAVVPPSTSANALAAGTGTTLAAVAKLHPGSLGLWLIVRSVSSPEARRIVAVMMTALIAIVGLSLVIRGTQPWLDYIAVIRAGSSADLVDPRNAGPAAQVASLVGRDGPASEALARTLQIVVTLGALATTAVAGWRLSDPVESLAWAVAASLVVLPVTWYHYPSALIPFALAAVLRALGTSQARTTQGLVAGAIVVAAVAVAALPLLYVAIGLVLVAVRVSARAAASTRAEARERDGTVG